MGYTVELCQSTERFHNRKSTSLSQWQNRIALPIRHCRQLNTFKHSHRTIQIGLIWFFVPLKIAIRAAHFQTATWHICAYYAQNSLLNYSIGNVYWHYNRLSILCAHSMRTVSKKKCASIKKAIQYTNSITNVGKVRKIFIELSLIS